jgi:hypothetical protein
MSAGPAITLQDDRINAPFRVYPETQIVMTPAPLLDAGTVHLGEHQGGPALLRIRPWAYLRTMAMLAWSAFRHPYSTTVIDLTTGRIIPPDSEE